MPRRHVPKQNRARLQRRDLPEQQQQTTPFCPFPGYVRLNEKCIGYDRSKSAQRSDESELAKFFAQIEIKRDTAEMFLSMDCG